MAKFDSKTFNPQAFGAYVNRMPETFDDLDGFVTN